jgi:hypothetical protein
VSYCSSSHRDEDSELHALSCAALADCLEHHAVEAALDQHPAGNVHLRRK